MTPLDIHTLQKRLWAHKLVLSQNYALPKAQRDPRAIEQAKQAIANIQKWLHPPVDKKEPEKPKAVSKEAFRQAYKAEHGIKEPDAVIQISTIEELDKAWSTIVGKNIQIQATPEVKLEIKRRIQEIHKRNKRDGFR